MSIDLKKIFTEEGWKNVAPDCKGKDKELCRNLLLYRALKEADYEARGKALTKIAALAGSLKTAREVTVDSDAVKYLAALVSAAKSKQAELAKEKAEAARSAAQETARVVQQAKREEEEEDEGEDGADTIMNVKKALLALRTSKDPYYFLVCDAKPYGLIVSRKDIRKSTAHRKELAELTGGAMRAPKCGQCYFRDGKLVFDMDKPPSGLAGILQKWIKSSVGLGCKVMIGNETADDEDGVESDTPSKRSIPDGTVTDGKSATDAGEPPVPKPAPRSALGGLPLTGSVGRGGRNTFDDVKAVQEALNRRMNAGLKPDGKFGPKTLKAIETFQKNLGQFRPDGLVEPGRGTARALAANGRLPPPPPPPKPVAPPKLPKPTLARAPLVWEGTVDILNKNIRELKRGILGQYGNEHSDLVRMIDQNLGKLDAAVSKLDRRLSQSLAKANAAKTEAARRVELRTSKAILVEYITFAKSEPLINHIDRNPFGVQTKLKQIIAESLSHVAKAIG